ncbi:KPN_02809 family neutral zinc metallopeptidase [Parasphingorhabdus sp. DH2-15]|uniref:KPN_02809 family neutral zinc metallopeptidase n=1 Tax=Parasphingorhabdus sp. DH2-15 TaxID=3444112 RepID=UPI003F68248B
MRLDDYRTSKNVRDQRGSAGRGSGGRGFRLPMGGGRSVGGGKIGIGTIIIGLIAVFVFGADPQALLSGLQGGSVSGDIAGQQSAGVGGSNAEESCAIDQKSKFSCQVLASTEDTWAPIFQQNGQRYQPTVLNFYSQTGTSGCGQAQSTMGPFYCPADNGIYLDTTFFDELATRFGAAGDFAQAYVIAHEVGHHIQTITGRSAEVRRLQARSSKAESNALQVRMELEADCYAGVWAARNAERIEPGDISEGMAAANAIGDDTLQRNAGRRPMPESFTHGTSAQRKRWLQTGLENGNPASCDTFSARAL